VDRRLLVVVCLTCFISLVVIRSILFPNESVPDSNSRLLMGVVLKAPKMSRRPVLMTDFSFCISDELVKPNK